MARQLVLKQDMATFKKKAHEESVHDGGIDYFQKMSKKYIFEIVRQIHKMIVKL